MLNADKSTADVLLRQLRGHVGRRHVLTRDAETRAYRNGYRFGSGPVLAVVRPASLVEQWRALQTCVAAGAAVILQASNTGLTGGSTPSGDDYGRPVVIISTSRLVGVQLIDGGRQVVCLPGARLNDLERLLAPHGREPHSVIGSSCLGASVHGGVCNNSGGSLVKRGPAYTEWALYARVDEDGRLQLVNHLGIALGDEPETILRRLQAGDYSDADIIRDPRRRASDDEYASHVRDVAAPTPARFNADPRRLFEASGCAGKLAVFAVRLDTFAREVPGATFYIGTNDPADLARLRRAVLTDLRTLPISGEYIHRTAFDIAARYGKDTVLTIERLGTQRLPALFRLKARLDGFAERLGVRHASDRILQGCGRLFPNHLPRRMWDYRDRFEHHLILKMGGDGLAEARTLLAALMPTTQGEYFECTPLEAEKAFLHRFAVAGAAVRYRAVHAKEVEDIVALDVALPRNKLDWLEALPADLDEKLLHKLYYGHFFCHVFHQDYIVAKGHDAHALEEQLLKLMDDRGAEYPAEHNVGHLYKAKPALAQFYRALDPNNQLNPGIGGDSKRARWG